jgi:anti-sigma regulatory factor (Ser/Thr protein kinase)
MHPIRRTRRHRGQRSARLHRPQRDAPNAENPDRRAGKHRSQRCRRARAGETGRVGVRESLEVHVSLDVRAPATVRSLVAPWLRHRVAPDVLDHTQLVLSELVTHGVRYSGASSAAFAVVRIELTRDTVQLDVQDPGRGGVIAPPLPYLERGDRYGLNLVRTLSRRWGTTSVTAGGTRVWAHLARARAPLHRRAH